MAIQAMALGVNNPEINALSSLAAGQQARQSFDMNNIQIAKAGLETIGSIALGAMGGDINGKPDPALFNQGLDYLAQQGIDVEQFRDRADLAPVIARSSMTALQQMQMAQDEKSYQLALDNFELEVMKAAQGPKPTAEMQNFQLAQTDPAFAAHLAAKDAPNPPAQVAEYNFYVEQEKAAGREPKSFEEYQVSQKGQGLTVQTNPDGTTTVTQGGAAPKLTEGQSKDVGFLTRGRGANATLSASDTELTNWFAKQAGNAPFDLGTYLQSENYQGAEQAGLEFLAALLRKDSGGAITPDENRVYGKIYLPQPGNTPAIIEQKRAARERAMDALEAGLPAQMIAVLEEKGLLPEVLASANPEQAAEAAVSPTAEGEAPTGEPAKPATQEEYDALPSGALFIDPDDLQTYRKP